MLNQKPIKYHCRNCNHIEWYNGKEQIILTVLMFFVVLGMMSSLMVAFVGPVRFLNIFSSALITKHSQQDMLFLRHYVLNHTNYTGYDSFGFAENLFVNMPNLRYVAVGKDTTIYDHRETLEYGGDCKGMSALFVAMMNSVGYDAYVDCNLIEKHCVVKIPHQNFQEVYDQYAMVDLSGSTDIFAVYNNSIDHWEQFDQFEYMIEYRRDEE